VLGSSWSGDPNGPEPSQTVFLAGVAYLIMTKRLRKMLHVLCLAVFAVSCSRTKLPPVAQSGTNAVQKVTINNLEPRRDVTGKIIDAHDGCLQFFEGGFYLYGTAYGNSDGYGISNRYRVYSSPDLGRWTFEGELLKYPPTGVYYRPYVVFNSNTRQYVLWYNWYPKLWDGQIGVAVSDKPTGPFRIANPNVHLSQRHPGDGSLFVDNDGAGYFVYTAIDEGYAVRVERLTQDYLASTGKASDPVALGAEASVLFRRNNLYYVLCGPRCAACPEGSDVLVNISSSPLGPYHGAADINRRARSDSLQATQSVQVPTPKGTYIYQGTKDFTNYFRNDPFIHAQETWVARIPTGKEPIFIWMADGWRSAPDGIKGHDFQFWSMPLKFNPDSTIQPIQYAPRWSLTWLRSHQ